MQKRVFGIVIFGLILSSFLMTLVSAADGTETYNSFANFVTTTPGVREIVGIAFGLWDFAKIEGGYLPGGSTPMAALIIYAVVWIITLLVLRDLLYFASTFSEGVTWAIAVGLTIIAANLQWIYYITGWLAGVGAILGAISVWLEIVVIIIILIGGIFGAQWAGNFALKRRIAREAMNTRKGAAETEGGIRALRGVQRTFSGKNTYDTA